MLLLDQEEGVSIYRFLDVYLLVLHTQLKICEKKLAAIHVPNFTSWTPQLLEDFHTWKGT